jgi:hypothetical protein
MAFLSLMGDGFSEINECLGFFEITECYGFSEVNEGHGFAEINEGGGFSEINEGRGFSGINEGHGFSEIIEGCYFSELNEGHTFSENNEGRGFSEINEGHGLHSEMKIKTFPPYCDIFSQTGTRIFIILTSGASAVGSIGLVFLMQKSIVHLIIKFSQVKFIDKLSFTFGVLTICSLQWLALRYL